MDVTDGEREVEGGYVAYPRSRRYHGVQLGVCSVLADAKAPCPPRGTVASQPSLPPAGTPKALALLPGITVALFLSSIYLLGSRDRSGASQSL